MCISTTLRRRITALQNRLALWLGILSLLITSHCQGSHVAEIAELAFEDLLNLSVSTASKLPTSVVDSPGIVSVYSADEIELFGGRDLGEVLARLPGVTPFSSASSNRSRVTTRADFPRIDNNHVLILLNGTPFNREGYLGGLWAYGVLTTFPLQAIRQIEVIRGPGSVLYGTNAYSGVINIITKRAHELVNSISIGAGNNGAQASNLALSAESDTGDSEIVTALRHYQSDGEPIQANDDSGVFRTELQESSPGALVSANHKGLHATLHWGRADLDEIRGTQAKLAEANADNERLFVHVGYEHHLSSNWLGKADVSHVSAHTILTEPTVGVLGPIHFRTDDSRVELQLQGRFSESLQLVTGLTFDSFYAREEEPYSFVSPSRQNLYGAYSQLEYQWHNTRFIAGLQLNKSEGIADKTVPRVGVIHHMSDSLGVKAMYAEAFRAPYAAETNITVPTPQLTLQGNPDLDHETVKTWDLQVFYHQNNFESALTLFHTEQEDLIVRRLQPPDVITFVNENRLETRGVELEFKYLSQTNWYISGSATWQTNENQSGTEDTTLQPDYEVKVGIGYRANNWSLAVFDNYKTGYQDNLVVTPSRVELNPSSSAFHDISVNGTLEIERLRHLKLSAYVSNLLDEESWLPETPGTTSFTLNTLPGTVNGRTFLVTAELPF
ncbi:TonB-dependent receptor plug domain-containing protein [Marinobacter sp. SS21]|uniref:TonB-dependent receptor plug domain-containing protein n=1 Tax=Marinobacter sp. SS21 TaxID=2979460 RepID=UPI0023308D8C|nr:TonB-dependent receptor [Marinobacter sp. SS21]MDC0663481.1 TonB-dependent receptor [Marinobacter sp. SS21]